MKLKKYSGKNCEGNWNLFLTYRLWKKHCRPFIGISFWKHNGYFNFNVGILLFTINFWIKFE